MSERKFNEQELIRREKLEKLISNNQNPYAISKFLRTNTIEEIVNKFKDLDKEQISLIDQKDVCLAGRIMLYREAGNKAAFINIEDQDGNIQVYVRQDEIGEKQFALFRDLDLGDIVGFKGIIMRTNHGELSLRAKEYALLSKALRPLPNKHTGIQDIEEKYRRRYIDLITNPTTKKIFKARTKIIRKLQNILDEKGYFEVETPILHNVKGGAAAKPFITHYNVLDTDVYLRIATELYLKRLIVGGFDGVYEIGRIFRNEGMSSRHNPEFTMMELYVAYEDMEFLMNLTEEIFRACNLAVNETSIINYGEFKLDLAKPFKRLHMVDGIKQITGIDF